MQRLVQFSLVLLFLLTVEGAGHEIRIKKRPVIEPFVAAEASGPLSDIYEHMDCFSQGVEDLDEEAVHVKLCLFKTIDIWYDGDETAVFKGVWKGWEIANGFYSSMIFESEEECEEEEGSKRTYYVRIEVLDIESGMSARFKDAEMLNECEFQLTLALPFDKEQFKAKDGVESPGVLREKQQQVDTGIMKSDTILCDLAPIEKSIDELKEKIREIQTTTTGSSSSFHTLEAAIQVLQQATELIHE